MDELYQVSVSSLNVKSDPSIESKVYIKRQQIVTLTGESLRYRGKEWVKIQTISEPVISGYVPKRFLQKI